MYKRLQFLVSSITILLVPYQANFLLLLSIISDNMFNFLKPKLGNYSGPPVVDAICHPSDHIYVTAIQSP